MHILHTYTHSVPAHTGTRQRTHTQTHPHTYTCLLVSKLLQRRKKKMNINIIGYNHLQVKRIFVSVDCSPFVRQLHKVIKKHLQREV